MLPFSPQVKAENESNERTDFKASSLDSLVGNENEQPLHNVK